MNRTVTRCSASEVAILVWSVTGPSAVPTVRPSTCASRSVIETAATLAMLAVERGPGRHRTVGERARVSRPRSCDPPGRERLDLPLRDPRLVARQVEGSRAA